MGLLKLVVANYVLLQDGADLHECDVHAKKHMKCHMINIFRAGLKGAWVPYYNINFDKFICDTLYSLYI